MSEMPITEPAIADTGADTTQPALTILAVDDEPLNLEIMAHTLMRAGYKVECHSDSEKAMQLLTTRGRDYDIILLDRMMPKMDGMEMLLRAKRMEHLKHTPIIMQTAASSKQQIMEGIEAGAYYYLTKPYDKETLRRIVDAAARDVRHVAAALGQDTPYFNNGIHTFTLRTLDEAEQLARALSLYFPHSSDAQVGIRELLTNAIEHGNLEIGYNTKTELNKKKTWRMEIERRLGLPEYQDRKVSVTFESTPSQITLTIADEGKGFDWKPYLQIDPERATHDHGRGIAISKMRTFDELNYMAPGNKVTGICRFKDPFTPKIRTADSGANAEDW